MSRAPSPQGSMDWMTFSTRSTSATGTWSAVAASSTVPSRYPLSFRLPMRYSATTWRRFGRRTRTFQERYSARVCSASARTIGSNSSPSSSSRAIRLVPSSGSLSLYCSAVPALPAPKQVRQTRPVSGLPQRGQTWTSSRSRAGFSSSS